MCRLCAVSWGVVAVAVLVTSEASAQQPGGTEPSRGVLTVQASRSVELSGWNTFIADGARAGTLHMRSVDIDPALPSRVVERFEQLHRGVRIWGADIIRDSQQGVPLSIFEIGRAHV